VIEVTVKVEFHVSYRSRGNRVNSAEEMRLNVERDGDEMKRESKQRRLIDEEFDDAFFWFQE